MDAPPIHGIWHQKVLKFQGTNPEIDDQIRATELKQQAHKDLKTNGQSKKFYANAAYNWIKARHVSPTGLCDVLDQRDWLDAALRSRLMLPENVFIKFMEPFLPMRPVSTLDKQLQDFLKATDWQAVEVAADIYRKQNPSYYMILLAMYYTNVPYRFEDQPHIVRAYLPAAIDWLNEMLTREAIATLTADAAAELGVEIDPVVLFFPLCHIWFNHVCLLSGEQEASRYALRKMLQNAFLSLEPNSVQVLDALGHHLIKAGSWKEAYDFASKGCKLAEKSKFYYKASVLYYLMSICIPRGGVGPTFTPAEFMAAKVKALQYLKISKPWLPKEIYGRSKDNYSDDRGAERYSDCMHIRLDANPIADIQSEGAEAITLFCDVDGCDRTPFRLMKCPCGQRRYCSAECQKADWPTHKKECPCRKARGKKTKNKK